MGLDAKETRSISSSRIKLAILSVALFLATITGGKLSLGNQASSFSLTELTETSLAYTAHALVGLVFCVLIVLNAVRPKVFQFPSLKILQWVAAFYVIQMVGIATTAFPALSWRTYIEWLTYGMAFIAVVSTGGREKPNLLLLGSIVAGTAIVAAIGIMEYGQVRAQDPTWRIFSTWMHPNVLAGLLIMSLPVGLSLLTCPGERVTKIALFAAIALVCLALALTQSKGGLLSIGIGLTVWLIILLVLRKGKAIGAAAVAIVLGACLIAVVQTANTSKGAAGIAGRIEAAGSQAEQSVGFRRNLWKAAYETAKQYPLGLGLGTFEYESARSGLVLQTKFAHQSYLQLAFEGGWLSMLAFVGMCLGWLVQIGRGFKKLSSTRQILLTGVISSVVASGVHNLIDSNWYHFGIGVTFFALLGLGSLLAADGSGPEVIAVPSRRLPIVVPALLCAIGLLWNSASEIAQRQAYNAIATGNATKESVQGALTLAPNDGETYELLSFVTQGPEQLKALELAAEFTPSTQNLRNLARAQDAAGNYSRAVHALNIALMRDPNNLPALLLKVRLALKNDEKQVATLALQKMFAAEQTPAFKVRAIPEIVPTETNEARTLVAIAEPAAPDSTKWLKEATEGFLEYARVTVARTMPQLKADQPSVFPGESKQATVSRLQTAALAARNWKERAQRAGDAGGAEEAGRAEGEFVGLLAELGAGTD